jgi:hypothetical protein
MKLFNISNNINFTYFQQSISILLRDISYLYLRIFASSKKELDIKLYNIDGDCDFDNLLFESFNQYSENFDLVKFSVFPGLIVNGIVEIKPLVFVLKKNN